MICSCCLLLFLTVGVFIDCYLLLSVPSNCGLLVFSEATLTETGIVMTTAEDLTTGTRGKVRMSGRQKSSCDCVVGMQEAVPQMLDLGVGVWRGGMGVSDFGLHTVSFIVMG